MGADVFRTNLRLRPRITAATSPISPSTFGLRTGPDESPPVRPSRTRTITPPGLLGEHFYRALDAAGAGETCVGSDECDVEYLSERDVGGVVGGEVVA